MATQVVPLVLDLLGVNQRVQGAIETVQSKVGEYLATPRRLTLFRSVAARVANPTVRAELAGQVDTLEARYRSGRPAVDAGLALVSEFDRTRRLPGLDRLPTLAGAAAVVLDVTKRSDELARRLDVAGPLLPAVASSFPLALGAVALLLVLAASRRPSRRR